MNVDFGRASDGPADWLREAPRAPLAKPLSCRFGGASVPHPDKMKAGQKAVARANGGHGGEDSYFMAAGRDGSFVFGVSDGVYMWREQGIDAGEFSRGLMHESAKAVAAGCVSPMALLRKAFKRVSATGEVKGSATVCIAQLDGRLGELQSANVGDSGYLLMTPSRYPREGGIKYRSPHQEHEFGRPFQLGHHAASDKPDDAMVAAHPVASGDAVVMGSDGLWDNLHDSEIAELLVEGLRLRESPAALARRIIAAAYEASLAKSGSTPYAQAATEEFDMVYSGGKRDDISVIVVIVETAATPLAT